MAKRRTPPLFEVLSAPDRRSGPSGVLGRPPVQVQVPPPEPASPDPARQTSALRPPSGAGIRITTSTVFLAIAAVVGIVFTVWFFAFHQGQDHKQKELEPYLGEGSKALANPSQGSTIPPSQSPSGGTDTTNPPVTIESSQPDSPRGDPRKPGNNYLHIDVLPWKDAEKAVAYLVRNGVPATAVPSKPVDPTEARAKNLNHLIFALEAIPSDQYKASEHKRQELMDKVRQVGKKWQREEKGPSDFGTLGWAKFK